MDAQDKSGARPLHMAAAKGHADLVTWLIKFGVDVEAADEDGWTPLHFACIKPESYMAAENLVSQGQAPHSPADKRGDTPLHVACSHAAGEAARMLMRMGADAELPDKGGRTAMALCEAVAPQWPASRGHAGAQLQMALSEMRMAAGHSEEKRASERRAPERAGERAGAARRSVCCETRRALPLPLPLPLARTRALTAAHPLASSPPFPYPLPLACAEAARIKAEAEAKAAEAAKAKA